MQKARVGEKYGRWTVLKSIELHGARVLVQCKCGTKREVRLRNLRAGASKSCGCYHRDAVTTHGEGKGRNLTVEYDAWRSMRNRCLNPQYKYFKNYGGRGITVCARWSKYENFLKDMGRRPSPKHSLERRDNSRGYSPSNCYWATSTEQNCNTRKTRRLTYRGETKALAA